MIIALPAIENVAIADKVAIEGARKAYGALTDDQNAEASEETLQKLTDAEIVLAAAVFNRLHLQDKCEE